MATLKDSGTFTQNNGNLTVTNANVAAGDLVFLTINAQAGSSTPYFSCGADDIVDGSFKSLVSKVGGGTIQNANLTVAFQVLG